MQDTKRISTKLQDTQAHPTNNTYTVKIKIKFVNLLSSIVVASTLAASELLPTWFIAQI